MSVHARAQLFLIRPANVSRIVTRNASVARRMHALALTARAPSHLHNASRSKHILTLGAFLSAGVAALTTEPALCEELDAIFAQVSDGASGAPKKGNGDRRPSLKEEVDKFVDLLAGRAGEITLSGVLGFCSGYALKEVGKLAAVTVGTLFVLAQVAASKGYIQINWTKVNKDVIEAVDPDGDGKLTKKDLEIGYQRLMKILKTNLPSSAGFAGGFLVGVSSS
ncbi:hypothetical protein Poli38472_003417 [Pythium oligandrum]|uniref:EF-hand domain-containing protein n=1 Tax=Pythium oligandrum TaxID=41045 RepID=A0A8K1C7L2_PYTOL|nr:hypothetical protein Poli38472_003417 [Pythium oligandrum]|eukprot:TMW57492.1 hypothetical protein Poli38472_003417 [Pythium oligandrum]